jgi:uncharacterized membrane protein
MGAILVQIKRLNTSLAPRRFLQVAGLMYFVVIYLVTLTPDPGYLILSGVMTKIGVSVLLLTLIMDKGDC